MLYLDVSFACHHQPGRAGEADTAFLAHVRYSDIQTFVLFGEEGGGSITLTANLILAFDDSDILAFSANGVGGDVFLNAPIFFGENFQPTPQSTTPEELQALDKNNRVDVNATGGIASGNIILPDLSSIGNSLTNLEDTIIDTASLTAGSCIARTDADQGSFVVTGGDGLPPHPGDTGISAYPTGTVQTTNPSGALLPRMHPTANINPIQEPDGVYQLPDGRLVLSRTCD